ncbi:MAG: pseudouridine-5'-phosphate glycosidase [Bacteroidia bacterium]|nr:pseudouridine-5'-phosphate glycosidase [Bacteroidia bacterium]
MPVSSYLDLHPEVAQAIAAGAPVVALESTIISHGMPYPENLETAQRLEAIVREEGAVPATIAIIGGRVKVGLEESDLLLLAQGKQGPVFKASRRDLSMLLAQKQYAATTVAATMICASWAGIKMFATGGIGGVHRGAGDNFDISADLTELATTPVAVVSAGVKSILDIGSTLEYLETLGVPVMCLGSDEFPAFYTRSSGFPAPARVNDPETAARILHTHWDLGLGGGVLIANPVPEQYAMDPATIQLAIDQALAECEQQKITGKEITPFLLGRIKTLTEGKSLFSNMQLVYHNARMAAAIARHWAQLSS